MREDMILTITLNPAVDKTYTTGALMLGQVNRMRTVNNIAGGKGINVAKILRQYGYEVATAGFLGGYTGQFEKIMEGLQIPKIYHVIKSPISIRYSILPYISVFPHNPSVYDMYIFLGKNRLDIAGTERFQQPQLFNQPFGNISQGHCHVDMDFFLQVFLRQLALFVDLFSESIHILLQSREREEAVRIAAELKNLNDIRKEMTVKGTEEAVAVIEREGLRKDRVLVVYLPEVHESLAGIIAGRIREKYGKPAFVLTRGEDGVKGSGRSVESYHMYEELTGCKEFFTKYGGHKMAAGLSMREGDVDAFRKKINEKCQAPDPQNIPCHKIPHFHPLFHTSLHFCFSPQSFRL